MSYLLDPSLELAPGLQRTCFGALVLLWLAWRLGSLLKVASQCPVRSNSSLHKEHGCKDLMRKREKLKVQLEQYPSVLGISLSGMLHVVSAPRMLLRHYVRVVKSRNRLTICEGLILGRAPVFPTLFKLSKTSMSMYPQRRM